MAYVLLLIGAMLTISGVQGTHGTLFKLVREDFSGPNSFVYWAASVGAIGAVGYVPAFKELSRAFLVLILLVMVISNRGAFAKFTEALESTTEPPLRGSIP